jgi:chitin disaccharide deacetylase
VRGLVVNADDFGLAQGVNEGIIEAHIAGIVTSTSLMVLRPAAEAAAGLAEDHPQLSIGMHFEDDGSADLHEPAQATRAFTSQVDRFRDLLGRDPTHVDSHHHVHAQHLRTFGSLVEPLGVPLRHDGRVPYIGDFWGQPDPAHVGSAFLRQMIETKVGEGLSELGCHPARISEDLRSSYVQERALELRTLTEPGLREELKSIGVSLVSFGAWTPPAGTA